MVSRLIFRASASQVIGRGHISRCIAAAEMLKDYFNISFVFLRSEEDFCCKLINKYNFIIVDSDEALIEMLQKEDLLWIDGYHFTKEWKIKVRKVVKKIIETNDIPFSPQHVDIIFNHSPGIALKQFGDYNDTRIYLGLDYALLRQSFLKTAKQDRRSADGEGVFICFGGADTFDLGQKFVSTLLSRNFSDTIHWVTNTVSSASSVELPPNVIVLTNLSDSEMIQYMSLSKVLLIPSSVLIFEGIAVRKPIFSCYFVDNQKLIHQGALSDGLTEGMGYVETIHDVDRVLNDFMIFYNNIEKQNQQIERQRQLLDGNSDIRIRKILLEEV
jgi:spore coat polysaccharide biosynthesis predicted glycosyltransferase SpsG